MLENKQQSKLIASV